MPTMKGNVAIAANTTNQDILGGQDYEFLPWHALVSCYLAQSATGLEVDVKANAQDVASTTIPNIAAAAGRVQQDTDAIFTHEQLAAGTRLRLIGRNTTAGALTLHYHFEIDPLG